MPGDLTRAAKAGLAYFAVVFAAGFAMGTARELVIAPRLGSVGAVLVELPIMLVLSWFAAGRLVMAFAVASDGAARLAMGALAFVLLQGGEMALAAAFGLAPVAYVAGLASLKGAIGLAGQVAFALIPLFVKD